MKQSGPNVPIGLVHPGLARAILLAVAMALAAAAVRLGFDDLLGPQSAFLIFIPAVVVASAVAGLLPGILAAGFGAALAFYCDARLAPLAPSNAVAATAFLLVALAVAVGGEWFQRARCQADRVNRDFARREAHLRSILETVPDAMIVIDEAGLMRDSAKRRNACSDGSRMKCSGRTSACLCRPRTAKLMTAICDAITRPVRSGSSGWAGSSSANGATDRPSLWSFRSARCKSTASVTLQGSSVT
jgi:PAS domain-containing protein